MGSRWGNYWPMTRQKAQYVYSVIEKNPGLRMAGVAKLTGFRRDVILRLLPALEHFSLLLWEDKEGNLYPFQLSGRYDNVSAFSDYRQRKILL